MNKRAVVIATLAVIMCLSAGALASAADALVYIHNYTDHMIYVTVFNQYDPVKVFYCQELAIEPGFVGEVEDGHWPFCGAYEEFYIRVRDEKWTMWVRAFENVKRGTHLEIR